MNSSFVWLTNISLVSNNNYLKMLSKPSILWLCIPLVIQFFATSILATEIVVLQEDGKFSSKSLLRHKNGIGDEPLENFTFCIRMSVNFFRGSKSFFLSYANKDDADALFGNFAYHIDGNHESDTDPASLPTWGIRLCKHFTISKECIQTNVSQFPFHNYIHVCLIYKKSTPQKAGHVNSDMELFIDGKSVKQERHIIGELDFRPLGTGGAFIIGQEQDIINGAFDKNQAFSGNVTQIEMWKTNLSASDIRRVANCESQTVDQSDTVIAWKNLDTNWSLEGGANLVEESLSLICQQDYSYHNNMLIMHKASYDDIKLSCDQVGGQLPIVNANRLIDKFQEDTNELMRNFTSEGDYNNCITENGLVNVWLGQYKKTASGGSWSNPYDQDTIFADFEIPDTESNCVYVLGKKVFPEECAQPAACGICVLGQEKDIPKTIIKMKGVCGEDLMRNKYYDLDYYVYGVKNGRPHFRGTTNSHIYFDDSTNRWKMESLRDPSKMLETLNKLPDTLPIGTHIWSVKYEDAICKLNTSQTHELTFTNCFPNKYTCDSGHCIPLSDKCNTEVDCADKSDEINCDYLRFGSNYAKELIPREGKDALVVYLNISVIAFPNIDTVNLKFTADYYLNLRWYDLRIDYRDLNNVTSLNVLDSADKEKIWYPKLGFTNALGPFQTEMDELTSGVLIREGDPIKEDVTLAIEAMLFSGNKNSIFLTREYFQEYSCRFDLLYYPFDTQMCEMIFEVQGKTDNYVRLKKDGIGIKFLGGRQLVEYEIQLEALQVQSVDDISRAVCKIVFRRRMEFHVTNTFLQTLLLVVVGYMSFFFDIDNFTDRIMVSLTTMLVIATIVTANQAALPKTSYFKAIDYWFFFTLTVMILTMLFHTITAYTIRRAQEKSKKALADTSFFSSKIRPVHSISGSDANTREASRSPTKRSLSNLVNGSTEIGHGALSGSYKNDDDLILAFPKRVNIYGSIFIIIYVVFFNIGYWWICIHEYLQPAENYITASNNTST